MNPEKMGKFISNLRKEKGYSQEDLAKLIPVSRQAVSKWELGKSVPDSSILIRLSEIFEVNIDEILLGEHLKKEDLENVTLKIYDERNKIVKFLKWLILIIAILIISFLTYYFINSYNSIKVYTISYRSDNLIVKNGILVLTKNKSYFKLGSIIDESNKEVNGIELYYTDEKNKHITLYSCTECGYDNIGLKDYFGYNNIFNSKNIKAISKTLKIKITYKDGKTETIKLDVKQDFTNNKLLFKDKFDVTTDIEEMTLEDEHKKLLNLINEKFTKDSDGYKLETDTILATFANNAFSIRYSKNNVQNWSYNLLDNLLIYEEYDKDNNLITNILYNNELKLCLTDNCEDIDKIKEEMFEILEKI